MGGTITTTRPGVHLGRHGFALEARPTTSGKVVFVAPPDSDKGGATAASVRGAQGVWDACPLRHVMSRSDLERILARVNATVLPLALESRAIVLVRKSKGAPLHLQFNVSGDTRDNDGNPIWMHYSQWNMQSAIHAAHTTLAAIAAATPGVDAFMLQLHNPKPSRSTEGLKVRVFLTFVLTNPLPATGAAAGAAGGAGSAVSAEPPAVPPASTDAVPPPSAPPSGAVQAKQ